MKLITSNKLLLTSPLIQRVKFLLIIVLLPILNPKTSILKKRMKSSLFLKLLMPQKITRTIYSYKFHLLQEMMLYIWVPCIWDLQRVNQPELCLILDQNTLLSHLLSVMTKHQVTSSSRSTTRYQVPSFKETNWMKDARLRHMIWKNLIPIRFFQKPLQNWPMDLLNCKDSFGKTMPVSSHWKAPLLS